MSPDCVAGIPLERKIESNNGVSITLNGKQYCSIYEIGKNNARTYIISLGRRKTAMGYLKLSLFFLDELGMVYFVRDVAFAVL